MKKITLFFVFFLGYFLMQGQLEMVKSNGGTPTYDSKTVTDWLHLDNGTNASAIGLNNRAFTLIAATKFSTFDLAPYTNRQIEEIKVYLKKTSGLTGDVEFQIYTQLNAAPVYTQSVAANTLTANSWNTITLTTPYQITGTQELYVGYKVVSVATPGGFVIGADSGSPFHDVNYLWYRNNWRLLSSYGIMRNWNIHLGIGGAYNANDCGVTDIAIDDIVLQGNVNIVTTIKNHGVSTLDSVDFNYQVDGGTVVTQRLTGLNLATGQSTIVTHATAWNANLGSHTLKVYVSNMNALTGDDDVPADDSMTKSVRVAIQSTQNTPMYEEFTASTCPPCATFNTNYFNTTFLTANAGNFNLVKYQMNWPPPGDSYYTAEGGVRKTYYGVKGVPTLFLDGNHKSTIYNTTGLQQRLDAARSKAAYFMLTSDYTMDASHNITVNVNITPYLSGNFRLLCAVVEKTTTGNVGNNGETSFTNVMMKMVPNANGTMLNLTAGTPVSQTLTAAVAGTHVEEWTDLEVVVYLQDESNKDMMQSVKSVNTAGIEDVVFSEVSVYPNPSNGNIAIRNAEGMNVEIYNVLGARVFAENELPALRNINVSHLSNGVYFVKLIKGEKTSLRKILISK